MNEIVEDLRAFKKLITGGKYSGEIQACPAKFKKVKPFAGQSCKVRKK